MATPTEIFAEAISVVPMVHAPVRSKQNALIIGSHALPAAGLALRYPSFVEVAVMDASTDKLGDDRRVSKIDSAADLPADWTADLIVIAESEITPELLEVARSRSTPDSVVVFAVSDIEKGAQIRRTIADKWRYALPYREHLPRPALFIMASDLPVKPQRSIPGGTVRIQKQYLRSLFTLAKDEYQDLFGAR